ncbi:hypothetical protein CgunFtcFv8_025844 [Champsocephalus gunnari]|uniref:Uncharacterized protein n=1 Tax=Champsocephalus gunnari TaxID=52237 RepID=A0AAN8H642_CHAGU|nr:hypothetical protein CgunFtcFv8_025844 [Champsocephalus gunnari]
MPLSSSCLIRMSKKTISSCHRLRLQSRERWLLDCDGMERLGLLRIPPMEPLVAAHLLPRMGPSPSRNTTLPAKADRFQSTMTERSYRAAALSARALNVSSLLMAYQAELCEDLSR